ncbi:Protein SRG1 [Vitis vinifera]|uniref:Protein SRG1 n=1 Tax=Vitis vinifera TaxID=29760 RepID=A0A438JPA7_VITVI|nr:Protein SRG1 [Vitis vinifera]
METDSQKVVLGKSIIVPSVSELVKESITKVRPRYVYHEQDPPTAADGEIWLQAIPVIDLHGLLHGDSMDSELERLHAACKDWGFFQVVNHGVSSSLLEEFKGEVQDFFLLPLEEKKKLWQQPDNHQGFGQLFVVSDEQRLDCFKDEAEEIRDMFTDGFQSMRMNYYPPCPEPDMTIGLTPHSDAGALTILLQLDDTDGLQIRKEGRWIPVKPLPNAFVINVGDIMEGTPEKFGRPIQIVSNGVYHSIEHRVMVNSAKERLSVATSNSSNINSELGPAPSLISPQNPAKFQRVPTEKYYKDFFARKLDGKSHLKFLKIDQDGGHTS